MLIPIASEMLQAWFDQFGSRRVSATELGPIIKPDAKDGINLSGLITIGKRIARTAANPPVGFLIARENYPSGEDKLAKAWRIMRVQENQILIGETSEANS